MPNLPDIRPLVVGYPRTGFTLLISVVAELGRIRALLGPRPGQRILRALCDEAGMQVARRIEAVFERHGLEGDLLYNDNFRQLPGGPKWLRDNDDDTACFRKYIGLRGKGDFTLITSHPRRVLDYYEVVHSHVHPARWPRHTYYSAFRRFASIRHPAGTLTSACFSLNALASEYIQRFFPGDQDNDEIRQRLALYKLSDLNFFEALLKPYKAYLEEYAGCRGEYVEMRWEDLIQEPVRTIRSISERLGAGVSESEAAAIWRRLDHVNLTGAHKHNLRVGHGVVGGWRRWLTNTHLDMMREHRLDDYLAGYGYDLTERLDEREYTPFQKTLAEHLRRGEISEIMATKIFGFAFNKSNLDFSRFGFKHYAWRTHTRIERSSCTRDDVVQEVSDAAEAACTHFNRAVGLLPDGTESDSEPFGVERVVEALAPLFEDDQDALNRCRHSLQAAMRLEGQSDPPAGDEHRAPQAEPVLLRSVGKTNVVAYGGRFYALPQSLGPIDFGQDVVANRPGVQIEDDLDRLLARLGARR